MPTTEAVLPSSETGTHSRDVLACDSCSIVEHYLLVLDQRLVPCSETVSPIGVDKESEVLRTDEV